MLNNRYRKEIAKLDLLILNWNMLANSGTRYNKLGTYDIDSSVGLCHNAYLYDVPKSVMHSIYETFKDFSGDYSYPLSASEWLTNDNKFTVERLRLAKHIRTELFIKGSAIEKSFLDCVQESISQLFDNVVFCWVMYIAILTTILYAIVKNI